MSQDGIGVMLNALSDWSGDREALRSAIGKAIRSVALVNDKLSFVFTDNSRLHLWDAGQSCCESRYMVCDDDLSTFVGAVLLGVDTKDAPSVEDKYGEHEVQFLEVQTSAGPITVATHNEHNGYYGGFSIRACSNEAL